MWITSLLTVLCDSYSFYTVQLWKVQHTVCLNSPTPSTVYLDNKLWQSSYTGKAIKELKQEKVNELVLILLATMILIVIS